MANLKLIQNLIQNQNKSGSIRPAPHSLLDLKKNINGVPFQLLTQGMSGVLSGGNLLQGISKLAQQLGGLQEVGDFQSILSKVQGAASGNPQALASLAVGEIVKAMGDGAALGAALLKFGGDS